MPSASNDAGISPALSESLNKTISLQVWVQKVLNSIILYKHNPDVMHSCFAVSCLNVLHEWFFMPVINTGVSWKTSQQNQQKRTNKTP
jgi:hypothetical protein